MGPELTRSLRGRACLRVFAVIVLVHCGVHGRAQTENPAKPDTQMPGMRMDNPSTKSREDAGAFLMQMASGTSMNPRSASIPMVMEQTGAWQWMFMGQGFAVDVQQTGPRGRDKFYSTNWMMSSVEHRLGQGSVMVQSMLSLEPATVTDRSYPELFQTGETAYGVPLVDAQHPHNFVMAFGVQYAHPLGDRGMMQAYYAPVGDPALGPVAFPHRASAEDFPQAPLGHHWEDSTHIAGNVATLALQERWLRVEASGFYGTEPGENRWTIVWGPMNSWSGRVSLTPSANWVAQISAGRLTKPERDQAGDVIRITGSLHYSRPLHDGRAWSSSFIWGRNHETESGRNLNAYLAETVLPLGGKDAITGRAEIVAKDELFADTPTLEQQLAATVGSVFQVHAYTAGYTRTLYTFGKMETAVGANMTGYGVPDPIQPYYGEHPLGASVYVRLRLVSH